MVPLFVLAPVAITKGPIHAIFVAISSEFIEMLIMFEAILLELVLIAKTTDVKSVEPPPPALFAILAEFVLIPAEFVPMLIMFAVILSEFAPIAMTTDVKSVEPPPPAPFAIAAEFVLILAAFY